MKKSEGGVCYLRKGWCSEERAVPTGTLGVALVGYTEEEIQKQENAGGSQAQCAPLDLTDRNAHIY